MEQRSAGIAAKVKKEEALEMFNAALAAADPYRAVDRALRLEDGVLSAGGGDFRLAAFDRIIVVGAGKAAARMASAVEDILGSAVTGGIVIVKYGHGGSLRKIEQREAGHPIPDEAGVRGTERLVALVRSADEKTLLICLLSGGGSALLVAPLPGITLEDKQKTTDLLLRAGASIDEVNAVRKHLSSVKGGRLARTAYPASLVTLLLSDVIGDRIDVIASGPTAPDSTTFADAARVIEKYRLKQELPRQAAALIERGVSGQEPETVKSGDACFKRTRNLIVGGIGQALAAAREKAGTLGYVAEIYSTELQGEARDAARLLAKRARETRYSLKPGERRCLLSGGETTVTVRGKGSGGRNQELALAFALGIEGVPGIGLLSAGTDGTDGPTDAAGAVVDHETAATARAAGLDPAAFLDSNDSYSFFSRLDSLTGEHHHLKTGPTGTNVMDIQLILVEG